MVKTPKRSGGENVAAPEGEHDNERSIRSGHKEELKERATISRRHPPSLRRVKNTKS
jgi:hypothetical protein